VKSLNEQMTAYAAYHRNFWCKVTHFIGVPIIIYSLFIPMGWFRFAPADIPLTGATLFFVGTMIYYFRLDFVIACTQLPISFFLLWLADQASVLPFAQSAMVFFASFSAGWGIQFVGHIFEGKKPALADNLMQIFNAPLFLTCEVLFILGFKKDLKRMIETSA